MNITDRIEALGACKLIGTHKSGSHEWLEQRKSGIGGSEVASILNLSPYTSALTLFYRKTGQIAEQEVTMPMRLGNLLEAGIIEAFKEEYPAVTVHTGDFTFASNIDSRFRANPDAILEDSYGNLSILEIKHTGQYWTELPLHYRYQVHWYQFVTGLKMPATVYAVTGGSVRAFTVEWIDELDEILKTAVEAFCALIDANVPPDYDGSANTYETVRELHPEIREEVKELECAVDLITAKKMFDFAEENLNKIKSKALAELDGAKVGTYEDVPIVQLQARGQGKPYITFAKGL